MRAFVEEHPEVRGHRHWDTIIRAGVASHHAGHMPGWKLVIEKLMSAGLLDAIFATATVAAGVDFPARTVVLTGADARTANGWRQLSASELQQMTGRAGRRGRDKVGFVVAAPGLHQDPKRIAELLRASPDPLVSQFRATYTTLLNLLDAYVSFAQVREIVQRSFAHRDVAGQVTLREAQYAQAMELIRSRLNETGCGDLASTALGLERIASARGRLHESKPQSRAELLHRWLDQVVQPGRVVGIGRSGRRLVMITEKRDGTAYGIREDGRRASLALERIGRVYAPVFRLGEQEIEDAFEEIHRRGREHTLIEPRLRNANAEEAEAVKVLDELIDKLVPQSLEPRLQKKCVEVLWGLMSEAEVANRALQHIDALREEVWRPFDQRAKILSTFGYVDYEAEKVTERGRWLADLHIDRPLLVGEALESGLFKTLDFVQLASVMAALTADEDRDYGELELSDSLVSCLAQFEDTGFRVATEEWKHGIEPAPDLNFSAAGAVAKWTTGTDWKTLVQETLAEEGDLFRMLSRTG
jgi:ATP-dependent RNA helicase HelY